MTPAQCARSGHTAGMKDALKARDVPAFVVRQLEDRRGPGCAVTRLYAWAYSTGYQAGLAERQRRLQP